MWLGTVHTVQNRIIKFMTSRTLRLETQWNTLRIVHPLLHEEARVLGRELDELTTPLSLSLETRLPSLSAALVATADSAVKSMASVARRFSGE